MIAKRAVNLIDSGQIENPKKMDILMAGMWIYEIWTRLQHDVIYYCWSSPLLVYISLENMLHNPAESAYFILLYSRCAAIT